MVLIFDADLLGLSTAEFVTDVLHGLIITVDGWLGIFWCSSFLDCLCGFSCKFNFLFKFYLKLFSLQNNCIGERNTRYFMAFLFWWVLNVFSCIAVILCTQMCLLRVCVYPSYLIGKCLVGIFFYACMERLPLVCFLLED